MEGGIFIMTETILERLAVSNFNYRRWSFDYFLKSVRKLGLHNIELCGCHPHFTVYEAENFPVEEFAEKIREAGITVTAIAPEQNFLPINIAAVNAYLREQSIRQLEFFIRNANAFGCDRVVIYPGKAFVDHPHSQGWMYARESVKKLCETAEKYNVTLLMTPVSSFVSDLMTDAKTAGRMLEEVGSDRLKICVNSSICGYVGESLETYFELFGDRIGLVQLADAVEDCDQLAWGDGELNLKEQLDILEKYHYDGPVTMELLMEEYAEDPHNVHERSLAYMKEAAK